MTDTNLSKDKIKTESHRSPSSSFELSLFYKPQVLSSDQSQTNNSVHLFGSLSRKPLVCSQQQKYHSATELKEKGLQSKNMTVTIIVNMKENCGQSYSCWQLQLTSSTDIVNPLTRKKTYKKKSLADYIKEYSDHTRRSNQYKLFSLNNTETNEGQRRHGWRRRFIIILRIFNNSSKQFQECYSRTSLKIVSINVKMKCTYCCSCPIYLS